MYNPTLGEILFLLCILICYTVTVCWGLSGITTAPLALAVLVGLSNRRGPNICSFKKEIWKVFAWSSFQRAHSKLIFCGAKREEEGECTHGKWGEQFRSFAWGKEGKHSDLHYWGGLMTSPNITGTYIVTEYITQIC